ncbi:unnamed protein product [Larinioides sclopetarius]|uniref:Uncharacterized protein n=1 Tax=Larinioides sclopetarius TaxID=280406 RepID=A0AAV2B8S2_9ARAC
MAVCSYSVYVVYLLLISPQALALTISPRYVRLIRFPLSNVTDIAEDSPKPYEFEYSLKDKYGTKQHRKEVANSDGIVKGSYGYLDPDGVYRFVDYIADRGGYRAKLRAIQLVASLATKDNISHLPINIDFSTESSNSESNELFPVNITLQKQEARSEVYMGFVHMKSDVEGQRSHSWCRNLKSESRLKLRTRFKTARGIESNNSKAVMMPLHCCPPSNAQSGTSDVDGKGISLLFLRHAPALERVEVTVIAQGQLSDESAVVSCWA